MTYRRPTTCSYRIGLHPLGGACPLRPLRLLWLSVSAAGGGRLHSKPFSSPMVHKRKFPQKQAIKKISRSFVRGILWCTMWEQTRTLLFVRAASASHDCSPGSDAVVPPREDKRGVLKYQGAFAAYPRSTNWAAVFHSPLDISPFLFFWLIAEQHTSPYPDWITWVEIEESISVEIWAFPEYTATQRHQQRSDYLI